MKRLVLIIFIMIILSLHGCSSSLNPTDKNHSSLPNIPDEITTTESLQTPSNNPELIDKIWGSWSDGSFLCYFDHEAATFYIMDCENHAIVHCAEGSYSVSKGNDYPYTVEFSGTTTDTGESFEWTYGSNVAFMRDESGHIITKLSKTHSDTKTLEGKWHVFGHLEFNLYSGMNSKTASSITFYSDETFQTDTGAYGSYSMIFDGDAVQMNHSGFGYVPYTVHFFSNDLISLSSEYGEYLFYRID